MVYTLIKKSQLKQTNDTRIHIYTNKSHKEKENRSLLIVHKQK